MVRNFSGVLNDIFFLRKFSVSTRFVHVIVISPSGISVESYMLYYPKIWHILPEKIRKMDNLENF